MDPDTVSENAQLKVGKSLAVISEADDVLEWICQQSQTWISISDMC